MIYIEKIKDELFSNENITFAYIFGSYFTNSMNKYSDIDIAIYLGHNEIDVKEYLKIKRKLSTICKRDVDLVILNDADTLLKYDDRYS